MLPSFLSDEPTISNAMNPVILDTLDVSTITTATLWLANSSAIIGILRTIAVGGTVLLLFRRRIKKLLAKITLPLVAKEFEKVCNVLEPELWVEYQAMLEPGQTMANRPDLLLELAEEIKMLLDTDDAIMEAQEKLNYIFKDEEWNTRP